MKEVKEGNAKKNLEFFKHKFKDETVLELSQKCYKMDEINTPLAIQ